MESYNTAGKGVVNQLVMVDSFRVLLSDASFLVSSGKIYRIAGLGPSLRYIGTCT